MSDQTSQKISERKQPSAKPRVVKLYRHRSQENPIKRTSSVVHTSVGMMSGRNSQTQSLIVGNSIEKAKNPRFLSNSNRISHSDLPRLQSYRSDAGNLNRKNDTNKQPLRSQSSQNKRENNNEEVKKNKIASATNTVHSQDIKHDLIQFDKRYGLKSNTQLIKDMSFTKESRNDLQRTNKKRQKAAANFCRCSRLCVFFSILCILLIGIAIGAGIVALLTKGNASKDLTPMTTMTATNTISPTTTTDLLTTTMTTTTISTTLTTTVTMTTTTTTATTITTSTTLTTTVTTTTSSITTTTTKTTSFTTLTTTVTTTTSSTATITTTTTTSTTLTTTVTMTTSLTTTTTTKTTTSTTLTTTVTTTTTTTSTSFTTTVTTTKTSTTTTMTRTTTTTVSTTTTMTTATTSTTSSMAMTTTTITTTTTTSATTTVTYIATGIYALQIPTCATWNDTGITVAGNSNGSAGTDTRSLKTPVSIFIDNNYTLYVSDRDNHRITKYVGDNPNGTVIAGIGTLGKNASQLNQPRGVAVDQEGNIIVGDALNYRIQCFPPNSTAGTPAVTIGSNTTQSMLGQTRDLHINVNNVVIVTDSQYSRIVKFYPGTYIGSIVAGTNGVGSGADQFNSPFGNFMDENETMYVADFNNARVQKWLVGATNGTTVAGITGSAGSNLTQLNQPQAVIVDNNGYLYIADSGNDRIVQWTTNYTAGGKCILGCTGTTGTAATQLNNPRDLKFDASGNLYVSDQGNNRILKYTIQIPPNCTVTG